MRYLRSNISKTKHCALHNDMIKWIFFTRCVKSQRILFNIQKQGAKFLSVKTLGNVDAESH